MSNINFQNCRIAWLDFHSGEDATNSYNDDIMIKSYFDKEIKCCQLFLIQHIKVDNYEGIKTRIFNQLLTWIGWRNYDTLFSILNKLAISSNFIKGSQFPQLREYLISIFHFDFRFDVKAPKWTNQNWNIEKT